MSKGRPILHCRIDSAIIEEMELAIIRRNFHTRDEPWVTSDFVAIAIVEKLAKMARSRKGSRSPGSSMLQVVADADRRRETACLPK